MSHKCGGHGGTLEITSARDVGTLVRIILPPDRVKYVSADDRPSASGVPIRLVASA